MAPVQSGSKVVHEQRDARGIAITVIGQRDETLICVSPLTRLVLINGLIKYPAIARGSGYGRVGCHQAQGKYRGQESGVINF